VKAFPERPLLRLLRLLCHAYNHSCIFLVFVTYQFEETAFLQWLVLRVEMHDCTPCMEIS